MLRIGGGEPRPIVADPEYVEFFLARAGDGKSCVGPARGVPGVIVDQSASAASFSDAARRSRPRSQRASLVAGSSGNWRIWASRASMYAFRVAPGRPRASAGREPGRGASRRRSELRRPWGSRTPVSATCRPRRTARPGRDRPPLGAGASPRLPLGPAPRPGSRPAFQAGWPARGRRGRSPPPLRPPRLRVLGCVGLDHPLRQLEQ